MSANGTHSGMALRDTGVGIQTSLDRRFERAWGRVTSMYPPTWGLWILGVAIVWDSLVLDGRGQFEWQDIIGILLLTYLIRKVL